MFDLPDLSVPFDCNTIDIDEYIRAVQSDLVLTWIYRNVYCWSGSCLFLPNKRDQFRRLFFVIYMVLLPEIVPSSLC